MLAPRGPLASVTWLALPLCLGLAAGLQEDERSSTPPGREGPLDNDCFLPSSPEAQAELQAGDELVVRARQARARGEDAEARRLLGNGFERWHDALTRSPVGASVFLETRAVAVKRVSEGLSFALRRRLEELGDEERRTWRERFSDSGARALEPIRGEEEALERLLEVQRLYPGTRAAALAGLGALDRALESGRDGMARALYARTAWHARFAEADDVRSALVARERLLPAPQAESDEVWTRAQGLEFTDSLALAPGIGVRPGLAFLEDGSVVVQTPDQIHQLRIDREGRLERVRFFEPEKLLGGFAPWLDERLVRPEPPGWALAPATDEKTLVFVHGRTLGDGDRNALLCVRLPSLTELGSRGNEEGPPLPRLEWAVVGDLLVDADGEVEEVEALRELPRLEFQPGALIHGERVYALARASEGDVRAWILAFDRTSGRLAWKRLVAKGADLRPDAGRLASNDGLYGGASQALLLVPRGGGRELGLFCGTQLGAGSLVDVLDGAPLWTLKNRRRDARVRGWSGAPPVLGSDGAILWQPSDSDRLYTLNPGPLAGPPLGWAEPTEDTRGLFLAPVRPLGEALTLVAGDGEESVVLGRARSEKTVSTRRPGRDRLDGLYLSREEAFAGEGLASPSRLYFSTTRGVYLFDRDRELYLLDYQPVPRVGEAPAGGDVHARGDTLLVLGRHRVWAYRCKL